MKWPKEILKPLHFCTGFDEESKVMGECDSVWAQGSTVGTLSKACPFRFLSAPSIFRDKRFFSSGKPPLTRVLMTASGEKRKVRVHSAPAIRPFPSVCQGVVFWGNVFWTLSWERRSQLKRQPTCLHSTLPGPVHALANFLPVCARPLPPSPGDPHRSSSSFSVSHTFSHPRRNRLLYLPPSCTYCPIFLLISTPKFPPKFGDWSSVFLSSPSLSQTHSSQASPMMLCLKRSG